jgi:hypothetical protein
MRQSSKTKKGEPFQPMSFIAGSMEGTLGGAVPLDYIPRRNTRSLLSQKKKLSAARTSSSGGRGNFLHTSSVECVHARGE